MSLLVPDYTSSSEDEEALGISIAAPSPILVSAPACDPPSAKNSRSNALVTAAPATSKEKAENMTTKKPKNTTKKKAPKKFKTTLYLPPAIQRLLETGKSDEMLSDNSDEDSELLAKHKAAKKAANNRARPAAADKDSVLSFLPLPRHKLPVPEHSAASSEAAVETRQEQAQIQEGPGAQTDQQSGVEEAAWQGKYSAASEEYYVAQGEDDVFGGSSKRRRTRERDIERALEEGHFETVAGQIAEVYGPMPHAWQPPIDPLTGASGSSDHEVKVKASFWKAQAGTTVSSIKPSRLQRQKHQLNQLAFDAKARDFELLDKRGASLKTKRETYAKYGW